MSQVRCKETCYKPAPQHDLRDTGAMLYQLSYVASLEYDLHHINIISLSSYNGYKLNSLLTYSQHGIAEIMGSNPFEASEFFLGFGILT